MPTATRHFKEQDKKGYHSDDFYLGHHDKPSFGVNSATMDIHESPVTTNNRSAHSQYIRLSEL